MLDYISQSLIELLIILDILIKNSMKKIILTITILVSFMYIVYSQSKLVLVSLVTRHGDRAPFANIENANYKWGAGLSELTPIGINQEFNLGKKLRKRYVAYFKLLSKDYENQSISVLSAIQIELLRVLKVYSWGFILLKLDLS